MGECLVKIGHEACGSSDGLQVYEGGEDGNVNGYCWACGVYVEHPFGDARSIDTIPAEERTGKTDAEIAAEMAFISGLGSCNLPVRKLKQVALDQFGIVIGYSEADGVTPSFAYFPYRKAGVVTGYRVKLLDPKKNWSVGDLTDVEPFGWREALDQGARKLIIVEGEWDAAALWRIFDIYTQEKFKDYRPAIISVPYGAASAVKYLAKWRARIEDAFDEVALCFDDDERGQAAVTAICKTWPEVKNIQLPRKDANLCLKEGVGKAAFQAAQWRASVKKNTRIIFGEDLHVAARAPAQYGELSWPWNHINEETKGLRLTETIYIGAGTKMGKSTTLNELGAHFVQHDKVKIFMAKPEEANKKTYKLMAAAIAGKVFHDPDIPFDEEAYDMAGEVLKGNLAMVDLYQHLGWASLKKDMITAAQWGAKVLFVDPITNLTNGTNSSDANTELQGIAQDMASMALDMGVLVFIFCHLKAHTQNISREQRARLYEDGRYMALGNCPHELGGDVYSDQFAGSRAMKRSCHMMIGLEGNKDPELPDRIRNQRQLNILEEREFGAVGRYRLFWNRRTGKYEEL